MGLKDSIAFQQIALVVQSGGLQGVAGAQHHAQSGHGSELLLLPSHLYWSLRGKETLGKLGTVWVGDRTAGRTWPGYREQRFTEDWLVAQGGDLEGTSWEGSGVARLSRGGQRVAA